MVLTGTAALITHTLRTNRRVGLFLQKLSGTIFIGFGLKLAFDSQ
jgi:threonine/homoserine/homoserine lactone efflux protein